MEWKVAEPLLMPNCAKNVACSVCKVIVSMAVFVRFQSLRCVLYCE